MIKVDEWIKEYSVKFLEEIGIKKGDVIFDCCCGEGNYTLLTARIAGEDGIVYAMDMNKDKINILKEKSNSENLKNIKIIEAEFKKSIPLPDKSIDVVLLYDIFRYFPTEDMKLQVLLDEVHRILKDNALLSIYPEHMKDTNKLKQIIIDANFRSEQEFFNILIHNNNLKKGHILNFKKVQK